MKKSVLSSAVLSAMGVAAGAVFSSTAGAAAVTGFTIQDVGSSSMGGGGYQSATDGISGAFSFASMYINVANYAGASFFTGDAGSGTIFGGGAANSTGSFSTGFIFSSAPFVPFTFGSGLNANISAGTSNLTVTTLDFGGNFGGGADFLLPPDGNFPLQVVWSVPHGTATDEWDVAVRWGHIITTAEDPSSKFTGFSAQWVLEGCMTTNTSGKCTSGSAVPIPAAAWLFGSGLVGLAGIARRRKTKA